MRPLRVVGAVLVDGIGAMFYVEVLGRSGAVGVSGGVGTPVMIVALGIVVVVGGVGTPVRCVSLCAGGGDVGSSGKF